MLQNRFTVHFFILFLLSFLVIPEVIRAQNRKLAILIANSQYTVPLNNKPRLFSPLASPNYEIRLLSLKFSEMGFDTLVFRNLAIKDIDEKLIPEMQKAIREKKYDLVYFHYAGHGIEVDESPLLVPVDINGRGDRPHEISPHCRNLQSILLTFREFCDADDGKLLVVWDACRQNPFNTNEENFRPPRNYAPPKNQGVLFSAQSGAITPDGQNESKMSPFCQNWYDELSVCGTISEMVSDVKVLLSNQTQGTINLPERRFHESIFDLVLCSQKSTIKRDLRKLIEKSYNQFIKYFQNHQFEYAKSQHEMIYDLPSDPKNADSIIKSVLRVEKWFDFEEKYAHSLWRLGQKSLSYESLNRLWKSNIDSTNFIKSKPWIYEELIDQSKELMRFDDLIKYRKQWAVICTKTNNIFDLAKAYDDLALDYEGEKIRNLDSALSYHQMAINTLRHYRKKRDSIDSSRFYNDLALYSINRGNLLLFLNSSITSDAKSAKYNYKKNLVHIKDDLMGCLTGCCLSQLNQFKTSECILRISFAMDEIEMAADMVNKMADLIDTARIDQKLDLALAHAKLNLLSKSCEPKINLIADNFNSIPNYFAQGNLLWDTTSVVFEFKSEKVSGNCDYEYLKVNLALDPGEYPFLYVDMDGDKIFNFDVDQACCPQRVDFYESGSMNFFNNCKLLKLNFDSISDINDFKMDSTSYLGECELRSVFFSDNGKGKAVCNWSIKLDVNSFFNSTVNPHKQIDADCRTHKGDLQLGKNVFIGIKGGVYNGNRIPIHSDQVILFPSIEGYGFATGRIYK